MSEIDYHKFFDVDGDWLIYNGPRLETEEQAWEITFAKWDVIIEQKGAIMMGLNWSTCGLCLLNFNEDEQYAECEKCPIGIFTEHDACETTPYDLYIRAENDDDRLKAAKEELKFLCKVYKQSRSKESVDARE